MKKSLRQKTWDDFSKMRRLEESDWRGNCICVTCGEVMPWKQIQLGHFIAGRRSNLLFNRLNSNPQCYRCNVLLSGNMVEYYEFMLRKHGKEVIDHLKRENKVVKKFKPKELEEMRKIYKAKIKELIG